MRSLRFCDRGQLLLLKDLDLGSGSHLLRSQASEVDEMSQSDIQREVAARFR